MHERFEHRIEEGLERIASSCRKSRQKPLVIAERIGKLMGQNTRAAGLFRVQIKDRQELRRWSGLNWIRGEWARLSEGCYMLRKQCNRLDPRGTLESLHPVDGS